jgi:hypothetical protein
VQANDEDKANEV